MTKVTQILDEAGEPSRRRIHLREISGDSETPLETVGQDLRAARLRRGDDLATVSRSLKIRKDHLEAVEEDNLAALPGKTYAIGFVRSYSGYLGLDSARIVERYKQEISGRHDENVPQDSSLHDDDTRRLPSGWRLLAGVVGLVLIYGVWHLVSAGPSPQPVPAAPAIGTPTPQVLSAETLAPAPQPQLVAPAATGDTATPPPAQHVEAAPPPPAPPARSVGGMMSSGDLAATATQGRAIPSPAVPAVPPQDAARPAPGSGQVYGRLNSNSHVTLRVRSEVRLTVKGADGTLYLNRDLKPGDSYQVPDIAGLWMATSDAGAVDVVVDGMEKGRAGQNQQILGRVSLDPASLADRFATR